MRLFLRNLIFAALALALLLKVYMWYRVSASVDRIESMVLPLGTLTHSDVAASFNGDVTISDIRFIPNTPQGGRYFSTNELVVHTPGAHYLLGLGGTLGEGLFPERLGITLDGLRLGTEAGSRGASMSVSGNPFEALGCGGIEFFAPTDLQAMGYSLLTPKITAHYAIAPGNERLEIVLASRTRRVSNIYLEADLLVPNLETMLFMDGPPSVSLGSLTLRYRDAAFNERRNEYCAELSGLTEVAYLDEHLTQVEAALARQRIQPGPAFLSRYRQLMAPGAELEVWSSPSQALSLGSLQSMGLERLIEALGLSYSVNGSDVDSLDLTFNAQPPQLDPAAPAAVEGETSAPVAERPAPSASRPDPSRSLRDTPVGDIGRFVGSQVVINTITGRLYQGYVDEVSPQGRVMLTIMQRGGSAKVPINIDQIERLRVFR